MLNQNLIRQIESASTLQDMLNAYLVAKVGSRRDNRPILTFTDKGQEYRIVNVELIGDGEANSIMYHVGLPFTDDEVGAPYTQARVKVQAERPYTNDEVREADTHEWRTLTLYHPRSELIAASPDLEMDYQEFRDIHENLMLIRNDLVVEADAHRLSRIQAAVEFKAGDTVTNQDPDVDFDMPNESPATVVEVWSVGNRSEPDLLLMRNGRLFGDFSWKYDLYEG